MLDNGLAIVIVVLVAALVIGIGVRFYLKNKKPTNKVIKRSGVNTERLIESLGGKENIVLVDNSLSKVSVQLKDTKSIQIETIKQLGATGIVQNQDKVTMIFGKVSEAIAQEIKEILK